MKRFILTFTIIGYLSLNAFAQMSPDLIMETYNSNIQVITSGIINKSVLDKAVARNNASRGNRNVKTRKALTSSNLNYTATKTLQQQTVQNLAAQLKSRNPAAAQSINAAFGPGKSDYNQLFSQMVQASGLPANNAATAMAAYIEVGYIVVNNVQDVSSITPAMDRGLQQQSAGILSQNAKLSSPVALAKLGEELKLQAVVLYLGWQQVLKSGQTEFRTGIAQQFKQKGLDLAQLKLTTQGLRK